MTLESNIRECHVTSVSNNIKQKGNGRNGTTGEDLRCVFFEESWVSKICLWLKKKPTDFSLLVKPFGEQL